MISTFEIFGRARSHGKKFLKLFQTSFSGIVNFVSVLWHSCRLHALFNAGLEHSRSNLVFKVRKSLFPECFSVQVSKIRKHSPDVISTFSKLTIKCSTFFWTRDRILVLDTSSVRVTTVFIWRHSYLYAHADFRTQCFRTR